jgi:hypothetical protein
MTPKQMADYIGVSEDCLQAWRSARRGPPWSKTGKIVRYHVEETDNYLKDRRQTPLRQERTA